MSLMSLFSRLELCEKQSTAACAAVRNPGPPLAALIASHGNTSLPYLTLCVCCCGEPFECGSDAWLLRALQEGH